MLSFHSICTQFKRIRLICTTECDTDAMNLSADSSTARLVSKIILTRVCVPGYQSPPAVQISKLSRDSEQLSQKIHIKSKRLATYLLLGGHRPQALCNSEKIKKLNIRKTKKFLLLTWSWHIVTQKNKCTLCTLSTLCRSGIRQHTEVYSNYV